MVSFKNVIFIFQWSKHCFIFRLNWLLNGHLRTFYICMPLQHRSKTKTRTWLNSNKTTKKYALNQSGRKNSKSLLGKTISIAGMTLTAHWGAFNQFQHIHQMVSVSTQVYRYEQRLVPILKMRKEKVSVQITLIFFCTKMLSCRVQKTKYHHWTIWR